MWAAVEGACRSMLSSGCESRGEGLRGRVTGSSSHWSAAMLWYEFIL